MMIGYDEICKVENSYEENNLDLLQLVTYPGGFDNHLSQITRVVNVGR